MSDSLHRLIRTLGVSFLPRSQFLPGTMSDRSQYFTLCRGAQVLRDLIFAAQSGVLSCPQFLDVWPSIRPKPINALLRDLAYPAFSIQRVFGLAQRGDLI